MKRNPAPPEIYRSLWRLEGFPNFFHQQWWGFQPCQQHWGFETAAINGWLAYEENCTKGNFRTDFKSIINSALRSSGKVQEMLVILLMAMSSFTWTVALHQSLYTYIVNHSQIFGWNICTFTWGDDQKQFKKKHSKKNIQKKNCRLKPVTRHFCILVYQQVIVCVRCLFSLPSQQGGRRGRDV